jgi:hypothetical protein
LTADSMETEIMGQLVGDDAARVRVEIAGENHHLFAVLASFEQAGGALYRRVLGKVRLSGKGNRLQRARLFDLLLGNQIQQSGPHELKLAEYLSGLVRVQIGLQDKMVVFEFSPGRTAAVRADKVRTAAQQRSGQDKGKKARLERIWELHAFTFLVGGD